MPEDAFFMSAVPKQNPLLGAIQGEDGLWRDRNGQVIDNGGKPITDYDVNKPYADPTWTQRLFAPNVAHVQSSANNEYYQRPLIANQEANINRDVDERIFGLSDHDYANTAKPVFSPTNVNNQNVQETLGNDKDYVLKAADAIMAQTKESTDESQNNARRSEEAARLGNPEADARTQAALFAAKTPQFANDLKYETNVRPSELTFAGNDIQNKLINQPTDNQSRTINSNLTLDSLQHEQTDRPLINSINSAKAYYNNELSKQRINDLNTELFGNHLKTIGEAAQAMHPTSRIHDVDANGNVVFRDDKLTAQEQSAKTLKDLTAGTLVPGLVAPAAKPLTVNVIHPESTPSTPTGKVQSLIEKPYEPQDHEGIKSQAQVEGLLKDIPDLKQPVQVAGFDGYTTDGNHIYHKGEDVTGQLEADSPVVVAIQRQFDPQPVTLRNGGIVGVMADQIMHHPPIQTNIRGNLADSLNHAYTTFTGDTNRATSSIKRRLYGLPDNISNTLGSMYGDE